MTIAEMMPMRRAFHERTGGIYRSMTHRFKEKRWQNGKNAGKIRKAGQTVPFDVDQLRAWLLEKFCGNIEGCAQCLYCNHPVTAKDFVLDHMIPVSRGGTLDLGNLAVACSECNRAKGQLTLIEYMAFRQAMDEMLQKGTLTPDGYKDVWKRLKGQVTIFKKFQKKKPGAKPDPVPQMAFDDEEPF